MNTHDNHELNNDSIMRIGTAFFTSKVLLSAIEIGLFSLLAERGPLSCKELEHELGLSNRASQDFLDTLVALKMLTLENDRYRNTPETDFYLDKKKTSYSGHWLEMANRRLYQYWGNFTDALRTGKPQNEFKNHHSAFDLIYSDKSSIEKFLNEMGDVSSPLVHKISELFPWKEKSTIVDVGGCKGIFPAQLVKLHPHLSGGVFDLPQIENHFNEYVATQGLSDRLKFYAGDFFKNTLPSADVLVMGHVLVDWDINVRKMLISKAYEALPSHGALLIYDMMMDDKRNENLAALLMSLNMLIETQGGSTYTQSECINWLREAGFCNIKIMRLNKTHSLAFGYKP